MTKTAILKLATIAVVVSLAALNLVPSIHTGVVHAGPEAAPTRPAGADDARTAWELADEHVQSRVERDFAAMQIFRRGYAFWQHIFTIPDGSVAFGSAVDGRLLAVFPARGTWTDGATWEDPSLARVLAGHTLPNSLPDRRGRVAFLMEQMAGPVVHNATRGLFVLPNARRYGGFLDEWGAIYERFGVPAEIGLAQVIIESGLNGTTRSEARAVGFCQWLEGNWKRLQRLTPNVIEAHNQTSQAPYCAAYLTVLATKYGTFIPALSEHHAGGTNVGRALINGARLGGKDNRERYFLGAELARDLRSLALREYSDVYRTYGPRSYLYAEMVFGNTANVGRLKAQIPQKQIYAMRAQRAIPLAEITRRTRLSADEIRRFNPALVRQVPARANLYLPSYVAEFGPDTSFWHRPATPAYASVLNEFVRLDASTEQWDDASFGPVLTDFQRRFRETGTEEGAVMSTVLAYVMDEAYTSERNAILAEFRTSERILRLFERGVLQRDASRGAQARLP